LSQSLPLSNSTSLIAISTICNISHNAAVSYVI
jgi:hypothetical protein